MAIYNTTNVKDLPQLEEVVNGNFLIIENQFGSNIIDFKDFVIGPNNASFYNTIVSLSGYAVSMSATTNAGFNSVSARITSLSATTNAGFLSLSANVKSLTADVIRLRTDINAISSTVSDFPRAFTVYIPYLTIETGSDVGFADFNSPVEDIRLSDINIVPRNKFAADVSYYIDLSSRQIPGEPQPYTYTIILSALDIVTGNANFAVKIQK